MRRPHPPHSPPLPPLPPLEPGAQAVSSATQLRSLIAHANGSSLVIALPSGVLPLDGLEILVSGGEVQLLSASEDSTIDGQGLSRVLHVRNGGHVRLVGVSIQGAQSMERAVVC